MTEEERAALHRSQIAARRQARCDCFIALAGNREARVALDLAWQPYLLARLEAEGFGDDCLDSEEDVLCQAPDRDIYISQIPGGLLL
jgi:hypothetical protein